ncbi:AMP-dependent synthetase/ligase [Penicillium lagena]|uniref:AMP-dependent synthetase/ligase n=1 Tax=Penicillium lagena TaxID=94218 RepID=UPI0025415546|nr:AMP-dependent synthetase/ligase [Penicillium lagena]KAJ5612604.1 AMP-dependent synthetase/ligase [Penicillium lagena]
MKSSEGMYSVIVEEKRSVQETEGGVSHYIPVHVIFNWDWTVETMLEHISARTISGKDHEPLKQIEEGSHFQVLLDIEGCFQLTVNGHDEYSVAGGKFRFACHIHASNFESRIICDTGTIETSQVSGMSRLLQCLMQRLSSEEFSLSKLRDITVFKLGEGEDEFAQGECDPTVSDADLNQIWQWNSTVFPSIDRCMHDVIMEVARRQPEAIAVEAWDGKMTYGMLDHLSTSIASELIELGVRRNDIIPLCFEKSMWVVLALFGVLKAGGAALLLESSLPESRAQAILDQVKAPLILCSRAQEGLCSIWFPSPVVISADSELLGAGHEDWVPRIFPTLPAVSPSDLLYVVFTSGSTGTPKGCLIEHRHFSSAVVHQRTTLRMNSTSRVYDFSSHSFDVVWWSIFQTLSSGATLCIPSDDEKKSELTESLHRFGTTDVFLTPSVARIVDVSRVPTLRNIYLGGDAVTSEDLGRWRPGANASNMYGPAEATPATIYIRNRDSIHTRPCIGKAVGVSSWIVDPASPEDRLAPVGTIGELYLEGPLVGRGYLGDELKTAASFIQDPAWLLAGAPDGTVPGRSGRLYKTGDMVQYDPADGTLLFIGRKDTQVKLRGQRIELSEVESHCRQYMADMIPSAMVPELVAEVIVPKCTAQPVLVLFIQGSQDMAKTLQVTLEPALRSRLPSYMIPGAFISLPTLTLTVNGKMDRRHLREIGSNLSLEQLTGFTASKTGQAPRTISERFLQRLWTTILGVPAGRIGTESSFLRLGGDSISAMRLAALAREQGSILTVQDIFSSPTLSGMASIMTNAESGDVIHSYDVIPFSLLKGLSPIDSIISDISKQCDIDVSQISDVFPCTSVQKSLLSLTAMQDNSYVARFILPLRNDVDFECLFRAWEEVSRTVAPILSCRIVNIPAEGLLQVLVNEPLQWEMSDDLEAYLEQDLRKYMGLSTPLTRLALIENTGTGCHYCVLTQHHATHDGYSMNLLLEEVSKVYAGKVKQKPVVPFQAFIKHIMKTDREEAKGFWRQQFSESEAISFPALPHPNYKPRADCVVECDLADFQWPNLDATPSTILRTAWAILTARYTDTDDVVFGAIVTGRQMSLPGVESIIAPLINAVPVRVKFDSKQSVERLLQDVQKQSIDMIAYEQTELLDIRRIDANTDRGSRFNTLLVVQPSDYDHVLDTHNGPFEMQTGMATTNRALVESNPNAVMIICQLTKAGSLRLKVTFDSKIVDSEQMERITGQFEHVVRQICTLQTQSVDAVETISPREIDELWGWNSPLPSAVPECVHDLIGKTIKRQPQAPAVCSWDGNLTYAELDNLSTYLASLLIAREVGSGAIIPLCFEKSMWHPVAALAVMKSGAACVSMDVTQPESRLRSIVNQVSPLVVLASAINAELAAHLSDADVMVIDRDHLSGWSQSLQLAPLPQVHPTDVLYVVFTSGSTGTPKGVLTQHQNFSSASIHQEDILHIRGTSRVFDFVSYSFDVSWSNTLHTLICGGCLCIPSEWERRNDIDGAFNRMNCNYAYLTPSVARSVRPSAIPSLRTLAMGGEPITRAEVCRWTQTETIVGIYGPAECAQALSFTRLNSDSRNYHVGHPFGAKTWLVQPNDPDRLAGIGTVGELLIEGPTVSQGYLGNPEKTAAAYIKNPPWLLRGARGHLGRQGRLYRTGDLFRYNSDGSLDFLNRKDGMVKLRGQRVELAEVEYHVRAHLQRPDLWDEIAAEIITPQNGKNAILAVFVGLRNNKEGMMSEENILTDLACVIQGTEEKLSNCVPQYMLPGAYIPITKIPTTTTNKVDRRALRIFGNTHTLEALAGLQSHGKSLRAPSTFMEKRLQDLWATVLGIEASTIHADSSFFRIGGESIAAMQLVSVARKKKLSFTVADIFTAPRLSELAAVIKDMT